MISFIDTGVLIAAARGNHQLSEMALGILEDGDRQFAASIFLKMEVLPKAISQQQKAEIKFYQTYFDAVTYWANDLEKIVTLGYEQASLFGLGAMDALHVAAAILVGADELITTEKPKQSIHRTSSIPIVSLYS